MKQILLLLLVSGYSSVYTQTTTPVPPVAARIQHTIHGVMGDREDPYYWLSDRNNKKVIDYLKAENAYTDAVMAPTKTLQDNLFKEMTARVKEDDQSLPYEKGGYLYYSRYEKGSEYPIWCRKKGSLDSAEQIIVNGNELAKGNNFLNFDIAVSPDQSKACVIMDIHGRNFFTIRILDLTTGKWMKDEISDTRNGCEWSSDNASIVYGVPDKETLRVYQVKKHILGTDSKDDLVLLQEDDATLDIYVYKSRSEQYIFADAERTDASVVRYTDAKTPGEFKMIQPLMPNVYYTVDHVSGERFMIKTNLDAPNYRLCQTPVSEPSINNWRDIIPNRKDVFLTEVTYFRTFDVIEEMKDGLTTLRVMRPGQSDTYITFDEPAYFATMGYNPDYEAKSVRYEYSSLVTPYTTFEYTPSTQEKKIAKQELIPSGYKKDLYTTERIMVPSADGNRIPMTLVYRKDMMQTKGTAPGLIYGYGAYGYNNEDYFDSNIISLLDRGFVYANTHIRGGQEMGGEWYTNGKMLNKMNTFTDFIDCSKWLIKNNIVATDKLFANGGSAGGLLMGAVTNMAPELYRGVIADVPFVDVITTMEDESIPLTTFEWLEWGNPKIPEQYKYMMSYSPYDNVEAKNYPNLLVTTSLNDSQVQYFEPTKWVAKLRYMKTDKNLLLLKVNMDAGHSGQSGRYGSMKEVAFMYAFMLDILGVKN